MIQFLASCASACASERKTEHHIRTRSNAHEPFATSTETMREPDVANLLLIWDLRVKLINSVAPEGGAHEPRIGRDFRARAASVADLCFAAIMTTLTFKTARGGETW